MDIYDEQSIAVANKMIYEIIFIHLNTWYDIMCIDIMNNEYDCIIIIFIIFFYQNRTF